jgi:hypothetical protein
LSNGDALYELIEKYIDINKKMKESYRPWGVTVVENEYYI